VISEEKQNQRGKDDAQTAQLQGSKAQKRFFYQDKRRAPDKGKQNQVDPLFRIVVQAWMVLVGQK